VTSVDPALRREQSIQPVLRDLVPGALGGLCQPLLHLLHAHRVSDARALGLHFQLARRPRRAIVLAERANRQRHPFVERLRLDVYRMADAVMASEGDGAGADGHEKRI